MGLFGGLKINLSKTKWFYLTIVVSFLPLIFRFLVWTDFTINIFDIKDLLFASLAINLSNLSLVSGKDFDERINTILFSVVFAVAFAFLLGIMLMCEALRAETNILNWLAVCASVLTIYKSYEANNYVFETV